ncbi:MAG: hypothetical protein NKF39_01700 [Tropheryma whipplei]|uniref:zinc ribbon domain-containing protein n=1 Tax=Tropheryma whipplei TaxID=2039 RepID=UPI000000C88F|nr:C4-type zinc ribbon domain-containing protein [Tropheryma whipplei]MCO8182620.1 hypothetical protein [Tropheryma whipplei]CAD67179.1 conserved hypothetical protein [Tropheryma whipplei TW08/27]
MSSSYTEKHRNLLSDLQTLDTEIQRCHDAELSRNRRLDTLSAALRAANGTLLALTVGSEKANALYEKYKSDLASAMQRKTRVNNLLLSAKKPKELHSLQKEVTGLDRRLTGYADRLSAADEARSAYMSRLQQINSRIVEIKDEMRRLKDQNDQRDAASDMLLEKRQDIVGAIPDELLQMYNKRKDGLGYAVATIENDTCTGCCLTLNCSDIQRWQSAGGKKPFFCPYCDCFLI